MLGIVFNPITEELWTARKGKGAFYNGKKVGTLTFNLLKFIIETILNQIHVSGCKELKSCLLVQEFYGASEEKNAMMIENMRVLTPRIRSVRCYGSAGST